MSILSMTCLTGKEGRVWLAFLGLGKRTDSEGVGVLTSHGTAVMILVRLLFLFRGG